MKPEALSAEEQRRALELTNRLFVALSRAQEHLFLNNQLWTDFLQMLGGIRLVRRPRSSAPAGELKCAWPGCVASIAAIGDSGAPDVAVPVLPFPLSQPPADCATSFFCPNCVEEHTAVDLPVQGLGRLLHAHDRDRS